MLQANPGYESLAAVLEQALEQAQNGKGRERHATGQPFDQQPIMTIADMVGPGYQLGQAIKKLQESQRLDISAAIAERLGAINYIAASIIHLWQQGEGEKQGTQENTKVEWNYKG